MRAPRALSLAVAALLWLLMGAPTPNVNAQTAPLGAVNVVQDGWWNRSRGGNPPLAAPSLQFPVPENGLVVSASGGEPDKLSAVGITISIDPARFQRLILNLRESTAPGSNAGSASSGATGTVGGSVRACPITASWVGVKNGDWPKAPAFDADKCVNGSRSTDTPAVWSFDISSAAREWIAGTLAQNGVVLVENVAPPTTFQAAWGDRTTPDLTLSLDVVPEDDPEPTFDDDFGFESDVDEPVASEPAPSFAAPDTFEFSSADSFTVPRIRPAPAVPAPAPEVASPIASQPIATDPNLMGNLPLGLLALAVLGLGGAFVASYTLGPAGSPAGVAVRRQGGVSRALAARENEHAMEASSR